MVVGVVALFGQTLGLKAFADHHSEFFILILGLVFNLLHLIGYAMCGFFPHKTIVFVVETLAALCFLQVVACNSILSSRLGANEQGFGLGTLSAVKGLTTAFGPLMFGALYATFRKAPYEFPEMPFIAGAVLVLISIVVAAIWLPGAMKTTTTTPREGEDGGATEADGDVEHGRGGGGSGGEARAAMLS